jgi:hypothetical protein
MTCRCHLLSALVLLGALSLAGAAPVELARESFEGTAGAIGFTTSVPTFEVAAGTVNDYFKLIPNNGTRVTGGILTGGDGASMFAGEDLDAAPLANPATLSLTLNPVTITGKINPSVRLLLAAPGSGPAGGGTQNYYDWSATAADTDLIRVEASVDGGPFNRLAQFAPTTATLNQPLSLDTDGDGLGGQGAALTAAFQEFVYPIPTGTSVQVRVVMHSNATNEYLCVDNVRIFGETSATAAPVVAGVPATPLVFTEGSAAVAVAPAITVTDADSANLTSATVTVSQNFATAEDVLAATPSGAIVAGDIVFSAATGILTITRNASKATYETVLRSVTYGNTHPSSPSTATRHIRFATTDGVNPSNQPIREVQVIDAFATHALPFTESFETDGNGTRYSLDGRFTIGAAFFDRNAPAGLTNLDGTFSIVGEDTETSPAAEKAVRFQLNTAGFSVVYATLRLGAPGGSVYDTNDLIAVEASPDGGPWQTLAEFRSTGATSSPLALDTDNDGLGNGLLLSAAMQNVAVVLPTASTLALRIRCASNTAGERLVVDKISVAGSASLPDLAAYWDFNQVATNGLAVDSRAGLAARILGGAVQTSDGTGRSGQAGDRAMHFGVAAQRLHVPAPDAGYFTGVAAADAMSVSFWIKQTARAATPVSFVAPAVPGGRGFQAHTPWNNETLYFDTAGCCGATDTRIQVTTPGVPWTAWHHVALVKEGTAKIIYLDGAPVAAGFNTGSIAVAFTELFIGNAPYLGEAVDGDLDDFAVYKGALTAADVAVLASSSGVLPTTPTDSDGDGLPDRWELRFAADLTVLDGPAEDPDGDGLTNADELAYGTNPSVANTFIVTTTADSGPGSLREALTEGGSAPKPNRVTFDPVIFNGEAADTIILASEIGIERTGITVDATTIAAGVKIDGAGATRLFFVPGGLTVTLRGLTLSGGGTVGAGGAVYNQGNLTMTDCLFTGNTLALSGTQGGAIYSTGSLTVDRCTFIGNTAYEGGALRSQFSACVLTNCTFTGNSALIGGACSIADGGPEAVLTHLTIFNNFAAGAVGGAYGGGGIFLYGKATTLTNCLIAGNTGPAGADFDANSSLPPVSGGGNLVGDNTRLGWTPLASDLVGTAASPVVPLLTPAGSPSGPSRTFALLPGSPARDRGVATAIPTDQRGFHRTRGAAPDSGAYEAQSAPFGIGFNCFADSPRTLLPTDRAGVPAFAQSNWNNLFTDWDGSNGGNAPNAASRNDATGTLITNLRLWWDAPFPTAYGTPATTDEKLMWGYLDSNNSGDGRSMPYLYSGATAQPFFAIANLPTAVTLGGYRVVVYADSNGTDSRVAEYWLTSNRATNPNNVAGESDLTNHLFLRDTANFFGTYTRVPASATTPATAADGNYLVFENQVEPGFILRAEETNLRAPINAVQIVRNEIIVVTTAADELDPVGTLGTGISLREALRDAPDNAGILFDPTVFNGEPADTIVFGAANPTLTVAKRLTVDASNIPGGVTVNAAASAGTQKRVFEIATTGDATLIGLNLTGGYANNFVGGGGILNQGTATLIGCRLTGNTAIFGAAATSYSGSGPTRFTARRCHVAGNTALANGGGLLNWGAGANSADMRVEECTVTGNTAPSLSASIYNYSSSGTATLVAQRSTLSGNQAASGAGAYNWSAGATAICRMILRQCTVSGNTATSDGGGLRNVQDTGTATTELFNTIVAGNTAGSATGPDLFLAGGSITSSGGNVIGKTDGSGATWLGSDHTGNAAAPLDPGLAPLGEFGGPTQTMALLPGSPARNAGQPGLPFVSTFFADQRDFPIIGQPDSGAYEAGTLGNFEAWAWETLPATATVPQHAPTFDFDADGRTLLLEYAAQGSGTIPEFGPIPGFTRNADGTVATVVIPYRYSAADLRYTIERGTNLTDDWVTIATVNSGSNTYNAAGGVTLIAADAVSITFTDTFIAGQPKVFYRLKVTKL